jgi:hypothetical protein
MVSLEQTTLYSVFLLMSTVTLMMSSVAATSPHFSSTPTTEVNTDRSITADFRAVDLGNKKANVTFSSQGTAEIQCVNQGGNNPTPKQVEFEQMQNQSLNIKPKDGIIKHSLTIGPPTFPAASDICPNSNWSTEVLSLTYENPTLQIQQRNSDILKFAFKNITK